MSIRKYQTFLEVAKYGSITKAAEALGHTQSAVTQLMHSLEDELGVSLFNRSRAGIRLTKQGTKLLPLVQEIVDADLRLKQAAEHLQENDRKVLHIGTFTSVAVNWLPDLFRQYKDIDSSIRFEMKDIGYNNIEETLANEDLDFCFVTLPLTLKCKSIPLYQDPLLAVLSKEHPLSSADSCPISLFEKEPVISLIGDVNRDAQMVWEKHHINPNLQYVTKDDYAMIAMAEKGLGICIMPKLLLQGQEKNVVALPLNPPACRTIGIAFPPKKEASPEALRFVDFISQKLAETI